MANVSKERRQEIDSKLKAFKKKKYPYTNSEYVNGITGWKEGVYYHVVYNVEDNQLEIFNYLNEASLPVERIRNIQTMNEKEIQEYQKNRLGSGVVVGTLINPFAGLLVGLSKKNKKKTKYHPFLIIEFIDKDGNPDTISFKAPYNSTKYGYFKKFVNSVTPYLPEIEKEGNKVEL